MKIVPDVSYYNDLSPAQWDLIGSISDGLIIRLGFGLSIDAMANKHIEQANRLGLPYAGYWWADPTRMIPDILGVITRAVGLFDPASLYLDAEQYWRDWAAYMSQDLVATYETRFTPAQLNSFYSKLYNQAKSILPIPVGNYSADWFVNKYSPAMEWIYKTPHYWEARYLRYYSPTYWNIIKKAFPLDIKDIPSLIKPIVRGGARQFESYIEVKGLTLWHGWHQDWSIFTDESFDAMFKGKVVVPEPPTTNNLYRVTATALWIRKVPNGDIIGYKWRGDVVSVVEIIAGWARLEQGGWMVASYLKKVQQ